MTSLYLLLLLPCPLVLQHADYGAASSRLQQAEGDGRLAVHFGLVKSDLGGLDCGADWRATI